VRFETADALPLRILHQGPGSTGAQGFRWEADAPSWTHTTLWHHHAGVVGGAMLALGLGGPHQPQRIVR
jgi:hypothetical protein